jgi:pantoate--beta-alanine ligase
MKVFDDIHEWRNFRASLDPAASLGFVPTMGALHAGHLSLAERSLAENTKTLVSIFVNPTQFNDPKDLANYPRALARDVGLLTAAGVDYMIAPSRSQDLYPDDYRYKVTESVKSKTLCGAFRPGHFDGMLSVVLKLLNLAQATRAYFGEKDFQQLTLIREMAHAFFLPTEIVGCPTLREKDGLAMSSRNERLTPEERERAAFFPRTLSRFELTPEEVARGLEEHGFRVEYILDQEGRRYGAVHLGAVRLIDNWEITR